VYAADVKQLRVQREATRIRTGNDEVEIKAANKVQCQDSVTTKTMKARVTYIRNYFWNSFRYQQLS
jgi:hypothetical protein